MKELTWKSINFVCREIVLFLLMAMFAPAVFALDYPEAGDFSQGSKVWSENCARCHNMRSPSELRDEQWVMAAFHMRVRAGLTGQETRDVLTFLQNSNARIKRVEYDTSKPIVDVSANISGKRIYENNCMACHGADGRGRLLGVPDFTDKNGRLIKAENVLLSNIINGFQSPGSLMPMPPRGGNSQLSDKELLAALEYIKKTFAR